MREKHQRNSTLGNSCLHIIKHFTSLLYNVIFGVQVTKATSNTKLASMLSSYYNNTSLYWKRHKISNPLYGYMNQKHKCMLQKRRFSMIDLTMKCSQHQVLCEKQHSINTFMKFMKCYTKAISYCSTKLKSSSTNNLQTNMTILLHVRIKVLWLI